MERGQRVVLGTGGTIAGRAAQAGDNIGYTAGEVGVDDLLAGVRAHLAGQDVVAEQVAQVDSKDMGPPVWRPLLRRLVHHLARPEVQGIVITHGTDTLEETAWLLQTVLAPTKPVVITCAMRPATAVTPDGPQNLLDALVVAAEPGAHGVVAVCAGQVHSARRVRKVHTYRTDAFGSGDAGPLGVVEAGRVQRWQPWPEPAVRPGLLERLLDTPTWPRVEWITSHAGADGALVRALLVPVAGVAPLRGLVVAGTGNATVHRDLEAALADAEAAGVTVWRTTRCGQGRVLPPDAVGWTPAEDALPPAQARLALQLRLLER